MKDKMCKRRRMYYRIKDQFDEGAFGLTAHFQILWVTRELNENSRPHRCRRRCRMCQAIGRRSIHNMLMILNILQVSSLNFNRANSQALAVTTVPLHSTGFILGSASEFC